MGKRQWFPWVWLGFLLLVSVALVVACFKIARAEDYYCVSTTGTKTSGVSTTDIAGFGWGNSNCYGTIQGAINQMSGGDQVWVNDGTYSSSGTLATLGSGESGSAGNFTVIRARNAGDAILSSSSASGIRVEDASYVQLVGFHIAHVGLAPADACALYLTGCDHVLAQRCSWAMDTGLATASASYITFEDCFAFGGPHRYTFQTSAGAQYIVFRRCLVRWDYSDVSDPIACFANYSCTNVYYQNCVAVDCTDYEGVDHGYDGAKGFFNPNGGTDAEYKGCMVIAGSGFAGFFFESAITATISDCVVWRLDTNADDTHDTYDPYTLAVSTSTGALTIRNCTFGINNCSDCTGSAIYPLDFGVSNTESMRYCIIYQQATETGYYAVDNQLNDEDWNLYYGNTGDRNRSGGIGAHSITGHDPLTNGLFYVTQIEPCSYCQTAGENGGQIGAQIRTKIGADGTFYGDTGWNDDTGKPIWPWPYEDEIREKCAAFTMSAGAAYSGSPAMDGARGFCSGTWTLSSYLRAGGE